MKGNLDIFSLQAMYIEELQILVLALLKKKMLAFVTLF